MNQESQKKLKIALDAMGSDYSPNSEIDGVISFFNQNPDLMNSVEVILVGDEKLLRDKLASNKLVDKNITFHHASQVVEMCDEPTSILKNKKDSSLYKGLVLVKNKEADAFLSAGNTGGVLSVSTVLLGRINGVSRPTIGALFPTKNKDFCLVVDVGANAEVKPKFLYEFGIMGSIYASEILGIKSPRVGLLNIGEEESKGTSIIQEAHQLMKKADFNFIGNIEGRDILQGNVDVVICDGFVGNIVMKFAESVIDFLKGSFKNYAAQGFINKISVALFLPILKNVLKSLDYQESGGVPLIGVNGNVIIGHGKSTPKAIMNMINRAVDAIQKDINRQIEAKLNT
ncbi:MAG: phosphate acyltransferase PlsX [Candidatus Kapabacteria bacterium]|nr:phosphate acyltransferase PlsX [Candidatus Kapabacteria bacterium]